MADDLDALIKRLLAVVPYQGKSNIAFLCHEAADAITALKAEKAALVEALEWYADQFCEHGKYDEVCGKLNGDHCSGCRARAAIAANREG